MYPTSLRKLAMMLFHPLLVLLPALVAAGNVEDKYDYIIVGGGASGLVLANRLTEDSKTSVLVLEAGKDHTNDTKTQCPGIFASMYGDPDYDWDYRNEPQPYLNGRVHANIAGKGLGGGSTVNFMFWTHASQRDIDNWGQLFPETQWSWELAQSYLKKSETYREPESDQMAKALRTEYVDEELHGTTGPIVNSFPDPYGPFMEAWPRTFEEIGQYPDGDPRGGLATGGYQNLFNINPDTASRSSQAFTYYLPAKGRKNLHVLTGAFVTRILVDETPTTDGQYPRATGVSYLMNNSTHEASARNDVILSAGTMQSSKLLELSGIGDCSLLAEYDIKCIVNNTNVGENFQNHLMLPLGFEVIDGIATADDFADTESFNSALQEYIDTRSGPFSTVNGSSSLLSLEQIGSSFSDLPVDVVNNTSNNPPYQAQHDLLVGNLQTNTTSVVQQFWIAGGLSPWLYNDSSKVFASPGDGGHYFSIMGILSHPFSRGSLHIQSPDAQVQARLDPNYLSHLLDRHLMKLIALNIQDIVTKPPLSNLLMGNGTSFQPGFHKLTEDNVDEFIRDTVLIAYHHSGTCAMLPHDKGGVVDSRFNVYGVQGLRVVDASIMPMIPQGTINSVVIAVAERAADLIKQDGLMRK